MIEIEKEFGLVVLVIALVHFLNLFLTAYVGKARKQYGICAPKIYADTEDEAGIAFNRVQRTH